MQMFAALVINTASVLLMAVEVCMLIRALLSWFPVSDDNPILVFVYMVTEPIVSPIRRLFERMGWFQSMPIDISFLVAYFALMLVEMLLGLFA